MTARRKSGRETFARLLDWDAGQAPAERLAGHLLRLEGFKELDPSHPLGGPDGLKDIVCKKDGREWIAAAYFPRGQQSIKQIKQKWDHDTQGVAKHKVDGFVFVTNQKLTNSQKGKLSRALGVRYVHLIHLETIVSLLDSPVGYGIRLEFLDIEMEREEQIAFIASRDALIDRLQNSLEQLVAQLQNPELLKTLSSDQIRQSVPLSELKEFKTILDSIAGMRPITLTNFGIGLGVLGGTPAHVSNLRVPLAELKEFAEILDQIAGNRQILQGIGLFPSFLGGSTPSHVAKLRVPLEELKEFAQILDRIAGQRLSWGLSSIFPMSQGHVNQLAVPLAGLKEYEAVLDAIILKLKQKKLLESK